MILKPNRFSCFPNYKFFIFTYRWIPKPHKSASLALDSVPGFVENYEHNNSFDNLNIVVRKMTTS
jgi:hypothetical protein